MERDLKAMQDRVTIRIYDKEKEDIDLIVKLAKDVRGSLKYENLSHFVRCSVVKNIREEKEKLRNKLIEESITIYKN
jgi:Holliday junction resolvase RusA-like endonuclease